MGSWGPGAERGWVRRTARNKRALQRIFADQTRPKFLAVVPKVRRQVHA